VTPVGSTIAAGTSQIAQWGLGLMRGQKKHQQSSIGTNDCGVAH
jgi:hypothetical protein